MFIGIDLGGSHIAAGLVNSEGKILSKAVAQSHVRRSYQDIVKDMVDLCHEVVNDADVKIEDVHSIGLGCPGTCDDERGMIVYSNNFNYYNVPIRAEFQKYINKPVHLENDANCAALAESLFGAAKGATSSVTITLGTGLGGGIVIDGKVFSGFNFAGSELGHSVIVVDGEQCTCGRRGCWEAYASASALIRQAVRVVNENVNSLILDMAGGDVSKIDAKVVFEASKEGDRVAQELVSNYIRYLAEGVANIINIIMPEVFVIGGGVAKQGDYLLNPLKELVANKVYVRGDTPQTELKIAELETDAGIIGAAMLGR